MQVIFHLHWHAYGWCKCQCSQVHAFATLSCSCSPHHRMYYALGGMDNCCPNSNWLASVGSLHPGCDQADLGATG